jgi:hypothetical protein|tara:strand:- start:548 stop:703 length:156 start_codon:yes stop_codon:yes gene_type:complete
MNHLIQSPIFWAAVALASEIVGASKLKQNSVIQLIFETLQKMKTKVNDNPK